MTSVVNLWAVLGAGVASFIIGMIWYHPRVFGTSWLHLLGAHNKDAEMGVKQIVGGFIQNVVVIFVLAYFMVAWGVWDVLGALELAFWVWVGFFAAPGIGIVLYERRSLKLWVINQGYWFVALMVSAILLLVLP